MPPKADIVFTPMCLRFSIIEGSPIYYASADPYAQLDGIEKLIGIDPHKDSLFESNLGFLPIAHTVLIRGSKNILVDPNNHHMGFYGMLASRLKDLGIAPAEIDLVVNTHCHHDHSGSNFVVSDKTLVVGEGEIEAAEKVYWPQYIQAFFTGIMREVRSISRQDGLVALDEGVYALHTPGHSPGSLSILVETESERIAIVGDAAMTREEYCQRRFSHWYSSEQIEQMNESLDRVAEWRPTLIVPGHDRSFSVR